MVLKFADDKTRVCDLLVLVPQGKPERPEALNTDMPESANYLLPSPDHRTQIVLLSANHQ